MYKNYKSIKVTPNINTLSKNLSYTKIVENNYSNNNINDNNNGEPNKSILTKRKNDLHYFGSNNNAKRCCKSYGKKHIICVLIVIFIYILNVLQIIISKMFINKILIK